MTRIAVLQMTSGIDPEVNFQTIRQAAVDAAEGGAAMLFTPEMSLLLDRDRGRAASCVDLDGGSYPSRFADLAKEHGLCLALGSMAVATETGKWANRSYIFRPRGDPGLSTYDKIHMFDVDLASGESWRESKAFEAGKNVVVADDTPVGKLGLAICYDIRFPALFGELGDRQCDAIAVPAAFTVPTGRAHWHVLLRARAIEASAFVIAAAQVGEHEDGRKTYGHSLVVDPWGDVLLDMGGERPGLGFSDIDLSRIAEVRSQIPSLANRREIAK